MSDETPSSSFRFDLKTIVLLLSLVLNALGGAGVVPPLVAPAASPTPAPAHK